MWLLILGLVLFVLLIILHEYGHFLVAKRNGVEVEEFGVGFPPKLFGKKLGKGIFEGYYTVNLLPLGGFVRLKGENDADKDKGSFGSKSTKVKLRIMLAGVAVNLVAALAFFTVVAWVGMPQIIPNQFTVASDTETIRSDVFAGYVEPDSPASQSGIVAGNKIISINNANVTNSAELNAETLKNVGNIVPIVYNKDGTDISSTIDLTGNGVVITQISPDSPASNAGIESGESIISINGVVITSNDKLSETTKSNAGKDVNIVVVNKEGVERVVSAKLLTEAEVSESKNTANPKGYLGVVPSSINGIVPRDYALTQSTWSAPIVAVGLSAQLTGLTLNALGDALYNLLAAFFSVITGNTEEAKQEAAKAGQNVSGPVGIFAILQQGADLGYQFILFIVAVISLTLAIMNFLPIPALDGGRAFVMLLFRALKKPLTPDLEARIHGTGFALLMILFVVITVVDVRRFY